MQSFMFPTLEDSLSPRIDRKKLEYIKTKDTQLVSLQKLE